MGSHRHYRVAFACVAIFAIGAEPSVAAPKAGPGAGPGVNAAEPAPDPKTYPLQAWMKANPAPAVATKDPLALANAFDDIASFAPKEYPNWASIAKDGAGAARANRIDAAKAACRSCHTQYRPRYKLEMRDRSVPPPPETP